MNKIKKYIGEILLLVGAFLCIFNLMSFENSRCSTDGLKPVFEILNGSCDGPIHYFYSDNVRVMAGLGLGLSLMGVFIMRQRNKDV